jgi:hypothetical protein
MNLEDKTLLGSLAANSKSSSYRTLRGVGSTSRRPGRAETKFAAYAGGFIVPKKTLKANVVLTGSSVRVEIAFSRPGLGKLMVGAIKQKDS